MRPRKWLIAGSFLLMLVNRLCSFVLPVSSRPFINDVMRQGKMGELKYIITAVASAVFLQAITSYALTQLLSTEGQRLISELRM
jgi:subfamily B ATP-binding cassette protein MsbA